MNGEILWRLKEALADLLFPPRCVGCGRGGSFLCPPCQAGLPRAQATLCPHCGRPLRPGEACLPCRPWPFAVDGIVSPLLFEGAVREAVHGFKYANFRALAASLASLLADYLEANPLPGDVLVAVPLHRGRLRERGYNQAALLATELGRRLRRPVVEGCLVRHRPTPPQVRTASVEERRRNVEGAFGCRDGRLQGQRVLLIDDVYTTGATLNACAQALKDGGAPEVWGLTVAHSP